MKAQKSTKAQKSAKKDLSAFLMLWGLSTLRSNKAEQYSLGLSMSGRYLGVNIIETGTVEVWDIPNRLLLATILNLRGHLSSDLLTFTPDDSFFTNWHQAILLPRFIRRGRLLCPELISVVN
jgi:hypothetical protein